MAVRTARGGGRMRAVRMGAFTGGLNMRDAPDQVAPNECLDAMNITLDERGGISPRLGLTALNGSALTGDVDNIFWWQTQSLTILQIGTTLYKTADFVTITSFHTFTTSARAGFCDFQGKLVFIHPADGVYTYNNTTVTSVASTHKGNSIAAWQNKVWINDTVNKPRVRWSAAGDPATWNANDFVDVREKDDAQVTCVGIGQGQDVAGRPGLLVLKQHSAHRIHDSSTGAFSTIHPHAGAVSSLAVAALSDGTIGVIAPDGVYITDGVNNLQLVSQKLTPLFTTSGLNYTTIDNWCAGVNADRLVFSMARAGSSTNNLTLEFYPEDGWFLPHSFGASAWTQHGDSHAYIGKPGVNYAYHAFTGGSDDGSAIPVRWQSAWFELNDGALARMRRMRAWGRGAYSIFIKRDFEEGTGEEFEFDFTDPSVGVWGTGAWGTFAWGPGIYEAQRDVYSLGICKHVSLAISASVSSSAFGRKLLGDGNAVEIGAFGFYGARLDHVPLGGA